MDKQEIISEFMADNARKGHKTIRERNPNHWKQMGIKSGQARRKLYTAKKKSSKKEDKKA